jgi:hypothetical protein
MSCQTRLIRFIVLTNEQVLQIIFTAFVTVSVHYGLGKHIYDITNPEDIIEIVKVNWESTVPGILASITARISIAILLVRLFGVKTWFRWYIYIITASQTIVEILFIIAIWAQCKPVEAIWNPIVSHTCWNPIIQKTLGYLGQGMFKLS